MVLEPTFRTSDFFPNITKHNVIARNFYERDFLESKW